MQTVEIETLLNISGVLRISDQTKEQNNEKCLHAQAGFVQQLNIYVQTVNLVIMSFLLVVEMWVMTA